MSADYRTVAEALTAARPNMRAHTLVALAAAICDSAPSDVNDAHALGRWALRQPSIADLLAADKPIHAIKELRALTGAGLAQAKRALDTVR